mmetsp:Transcript_25777/g.76778  ORF Transcript_25777/g.76778 Transcript_25777/m.76778 type:complete len:236 (-) Transcript_25777:42-749(-)
MMTSTPSFSHGIDSGSRPLTTANLCEPTVMLSSSKDTSICRVPRTVSYFSRCAATLAPMEPTLIAVISKGLDSRFSQQRRTLRPMRPKPLIATFVSEPAAMATPAHTFWAWARPVLGHMLSTVRPSAEAPMKPPLPMGIEVSEVEETPASTFTCLRPFAAAAAPTAPTAPMAAALQPAPGAAAAARGAATPATAADTCGAPCVGARKAEPPHTAAPTIAPAATARDMIVQRLESG